MSSIVYKIQSKINTEKFYIGSTIRYNIRKNTHLCNLRNNRHANQILQNHVNKYGIDDLEFLIIETVIPQENLLSREQHYIDTFQPTFNIASIVGSSWNASKSGVQQVWNKGIKFSEDTRVKMSISGKNRKPPSDQARKNMSESRKRHLSKPGVIENISMKMKKYRQSHRRQIKK